MSTEHAPVQMHVRGLMLDPVSKIPMVILRDEKNERFLPIWIGAAEANAIIFQLEGVVVPRPLTHDLALNLVESLGASIRQILVNDLDKSTFFAQITLEAAGSELVIDARPSDAIALALRAGAPIYVAAEVLENAKTDSQAQRITDSDDLEKLLEDLDEGDLGKYTM